MSLYTITCIHFAYLRTPLGTGGAKTAPETLQGTLSEGSSLRLESALRRIVEEGERSGDGIGRGGR